MSVNWKKISVKATYVLLGLYGIFLVSPLVVSPILNSYSEEISTAVKSAAGLDTNIEKLSFVAAPNLTAGVKVKKFSLAVPSAEQPFLSAENASIRISLLPLLAKKIQIAAVGAKNIDAEIVVKKDGTFLIEDYLHQDTGSQTEPMKGLPFGFTLSNRLPGINIKAYRFVVVDAMTSKSYGVEGQKLKVSDFVLDKKVRVSTSGKVVFEDNIISNYDIKVFNKIMPNLNLHDLVFPKDIVEDEEVSKPVNSASDAVNIVDLFKTVSKNQFGADLAADIKTSGSIKNPKIKGKLRVDALTVGVDGQKLPESYFDIAFKGNRTNIDSIFFTSFDENEKTQIIGDIISGKHPSIDMTFRSNAKFNNIFMLADSIAKTFGINDFDTLSASGGIDSDFNINSDLKSVSSTGYLKILPSSIRYGLYDVSIDNIAADIDMMNNNVNINNAGFTIFGHPLKITGSIKSDSTTDIKLNADKISIKGLLALAGQAALLKENTFSSGDLSVAAQLKGKLNSLIPEINASIQGLNVFNKSAGARLTLDKALFKFLYDGKSASGNVGIKSLLVSLPTAGVSVPDTDILIDSKNITLKKCYVLLNNSRIDITGMVKDYINEKMHIDIAARGNLAVADVLAFLPKDFAVLVPAKGSLPLSVQLSGNLKVQNISAQINADSNNYVALLPLDVLEEQNTKIHTNIEIIGDTLNLSNTGISNNKSTIASMSGEVTKLYANPKLNLNVSVPSTVSFPIWGVPNSNISANASLSLLGTLSNPQMRGSVNLPDISMTDMDFAISDLSADLSGAILNGHAIAKQFKAGGIVASDLSGDFSLKDYSRFYLSNLAAKAFDGKVKGNLSYSVPDSKIGMEFTGSGLNSTKAVEGAAGIKNALTGVLDFNAKLNMQGVTDKDIINSMKGNVGFNIGEGKFINIGRLENLVTAQNVSSNSVLKSALSVMSSAATIQEADKYKYIKGDLTLGNGVANLSKILVAGNLMSYHVCGTYNILPNTANLVILGRLESKVVSLLGPLGDLSAEKLLSYIPKFGSATANMLKQLTADPASENISLIPDLATGSKTYKDFKVVFNGYVESPSSVRSFKWLSACDTTEMNLKEDLQKAKEAVKTNVKTQIEEAKTNAQNVKNNLNNIIETQKTRVNDAKTNFQQSKSDFQAAKENAKQNSENVKNLLQNALKNSQKKMQSPSSTAPAEVQ
ncbi:MAG: hypothetical protein NC191_01920 [Muribaculaceae bacterium]|nr:hypothetical protein [Muribaculaceae bacterium]